MYFIFLATFVNVDGTPELICKPPSSFLQEVYEKQKERILIGETLLLCTIGFDLNIQHPYKPLMAAAKRLKIAQNVWKAAWNYVNDWYITYLCQWPFCLNLIGDLWPLASDFVLMSPHYLSLRSFLL